MNIPQLDGDPQQLEQQMEEQEPPGSNLSSNFDQSNPFFNLDSLPGAAQYFLQAQAQTQNQDDIKTTLNEAVNPGPASAATSGEDISNPLGHSHTAKAAIAPSLSRKASDGARGHKHKWSQEETQALVDGCNKHGVGNWKKILSDPDFKDHFVDRSAGDLKDRFRTYFPDTYHEMYPNAKTHLSKAVRGKTAEGKSIFEKGKAKERRPFTAEEDAALRKGYMEHGSHWALIAKDPAFANQRRAIDLRDRFRNAFPEDYERAGFKPRPIKTKKDRRPSGAQPGDDTAAHIAAGFSFGEHGFSDGMHADFGPSDVSDGHLTDHGNLTDNPDSSFLTRSGSVNSSLGRSNSLSSTSFRASRPRVQQVLSGDDLEAYDRFDEQPLVPMRPTFNTANTMSIISVTSSSSNANGEHHPSVSSLFEQMQQATLGSGATTSEASSSHGNNTPPLSEREASPPTHGKCASTEENRCQTGKPKDAVSHKRRSHSSRTGKSSALERVPSVHSHPHGHGHGHGHVHGHSHSHSQVSSVGSKGMLERPDLAHHTSTESAGSEASWGRPESTEDVGADFSGYSRDASSAASETAMEIDDPIAQVSLWSGNASSASDISCATGGTPCSSIYSQIDYPNMQMWNAEINAQLSQTGPQQQAGQTTVPDQAGGMMQLGQQPQPRAHEGVQQAHARAASADRSNLQRQLDSEKNQEVAAASQSKIVWSSAMDAFLDPLGPSIGGASGWAAGWSMDTTEQGRATEDTGNLLSSTPLSHHRWAGDLHHHTGTSSNAVSTLLDAMPEFSHLQSQPESGAVSQQQHQNAAYERTTAAADSARLTGTERDLSAEPQDRAVALGSASWSPTRRSSVQQGSAQQSSTLDYSSDLGQTPSIEELLRRTSRCLSNPPRRSDSDMLEDAYKAPFALDDTSLVMGTQSLFSAIDDSAFVSRRRRSNDTLRNNVGISSQAVDDIRTVSEAQAEAYRQQIFGGERRNSVPAAFMLGQGVLGAPSPSGFFARASADAGSHSALLTSSSMGMLDHLDLQSTMPIDSSYAASLPDVSASTAFLGSSGDEFGSGVGQHQQQMYSYDDIDLGSLTDLNRSPSRLHAEAQALFSQLGQTWTSNSEAPAHPRRAESASDQQESRSTKELQRSVSVSGGEFDPSNFDAEQRMAWNPLGMMRSASASQVTQQRLEILRNENATAASFLNSFSGMPANAASLWTTSGSLDRLEHLYLEGLHSSPSLGSATVNSNVAGSREQEGYLSE